MSMVSSGRLAFTPKGPYDMLWNTTFENATVVIDGNTNRLHTSELHSGNTAAVR